MKQILKRLLRPQDFLAEVIKGVFGGPEFKEVTEHQMQMQQKFFYQEKEAERMRRIQERTLYLQCLKKAGRVLSEKDETELEYGEFLVSGKVNP